MSTRIIVGDALERLRELPDQSVNCIVTSPPYFGVRDYKVAGQIGLEQTPDEYIARLLVVFREAKRVLRDDGTMWIVIGDSYGRAPGKGQHKPGNMGKQDYVYSGSGRAASTFVGDGIKEKDLIGIPWMLAFALRADGWYLRGDQIWAKPNGMPESVNDRPTRSHEFVFLFAKSRRYFYDASAVRLPAMESSEARLAQALERQAGSLRANGGAKVNGAMKPVTSKYTPETRGVAGGRRAEDIQLSIGRKQAGHGPRHAGFNERWRQKGLGNSDRNDGGYQREPDDLNKDGLLGANLRSVWSLPPAQYDGDHYAVMPDDLAAICILAGCPLGGTVLDPFGGVGTTAMVANAYGRNCIMIELNPKSAAEAKRRIEGDAALLSYGAVTMAL